MSSYNYCSRLRPCRMDIRIASTLRWIKSNSHLMKTSSHCVPYRVVPCQKWSMPRSYGECSKMEFSSRPRQTRPVQFSLRLIEWITEISHWILQTQCGDGQEFVYSANGGRSYRLLSERPDRLNVICQLWILVDWNWAEARSKNGVQVSLRISPIRTNISWLGKEAADISYSDGRLRIFGKMKVILGVPCQYRCIHGEYEKSYGALETSIDSAPGCKSHPEVEEMIYFREVK